VNDPYDGRKPGCLLTMVAVVATCALLLLTAADCDGQPTKKDSYTCQAAQKQAADDPGNAQKRQQRREACT
jgi:hypothetical protein